MEIFNNIPNAQLPDPHSASERQFSSLARKVTELSDQPDVADEILDHSAEKYGILETEDKSEAAPILDISEQQIIDMMFKANGKVRPSLYGQRKAKPAIIGNFIDLRG
jgi:hypothetical protein